MKLNSLKNWLFVLPLLFLSCETLDFYGDAYYSVKGKITDENNQSIPNLDLTIYTSAKNWNDVSPYPSSEGIVSGSGKTDANGDFLITFPKSDGNNFLLLQDGFKIIDSVNTDSPNPNLALLEIRKFRDYLYDINTIKIVKP